MRHETIFSSAFIGRIPLLAIAFLVAVAACRPQTEPEEVAVNQILEAPDEYVGRQVTVGGQIVEIFGTTAFSIGGPELERQLLVLSLDTVPVVPPRTHEMPFVRSDLVQVTGSVRTLDREEVEREMGGRVNPELQAYDGRPVIVAEGGGARMHSVLVTPQDEASERGSSEPMAPQDEASERGGSEPVAPQDDADDRSP